MKVLVLMSTYNGERYLKEQIDSILTQEGIEVHLLIRDDGSSDKTCDILDQYSKNHTNIRIVKAENIGFVKSFTKLLELSKTIREEFDYYAFSDQDDVWNSNKLLTACAHLLAVGNKKPALFTSNSTLIDADGRYLGDFHIEYPKYRHGNVMIYGTEQGCSMVFNKIAVSLYLSKRPSVAYHDRWMFFICYYLGNVIYEHNKLFKYRLHEANTLANKKKTLLSRIQFYFSNKRNTNHVETAKEFYESFKDSLVEDDIILFKNYINYRCHLFSKIYVLTHSEYYPPFPREHFFRMILLNKN